MSKKKIKLVCGEQSREFDFEIAQSLLQIRAEMNRHSIVKKPGWEIPDDSPYRFENNGIIKRADKADTKSTKASGRNQKGNSSSEQA